MSSSDINKICNDDRPSKSNDDGVCEVSDMLQNMSTADNVDNDILVCANCGKEGDDVNNTCNKCKQVKYCNASCKKKHRYKHKKQCEEYVAKLHDEELFKQPPAEDCPICFVRLPSLSSTGSRYMSCCGKEICSGCFITPVYDHQGNEVANKTCAFCRTSIPDADEELVEREKKRMEAGDSIAIYNRGYDYFKGIRGYPQDYTKALKLWYKSAELGYSKAFCSIGYAYYKGEGVEVDTKKANHYWELAAIAGDEFARHNLGINEWAAGNMERALKHHVIAVRAGDNDALNEIQELYSNGHATKEDYTKALKAYQEYLTEIKSVQRDEAAAASEDYRYY